MKTAGMVRPMLAEPNQWPDSCWFEVGWPWPPARRRGPRGHQRGDQDADNCLRRTNTRHPGLHRRRGERLPVGIRLPAGCCEEQIPILVNSRSMLPIGVHPSSPLMIYLKDQHVFDLNATTPSGINSRPKRYGRSPAPSTARVPIVPICQSSFCASVAGVWHYWHFLARGRMWISPNSG